MLFSFALSTVHAKRASNNRPLTLNYLSSLPAGGNWSTCSKPRSFGKSIDLYSLQMRTGFIHFKKTHTGIERAALEVKDKWFKHFFTKALSKFPPKFSMDLQHFRRNFEKIRNRQKYYHILKEHPKLRVKSQSLAVKCSKIWKI